MTHVARQAPAQRVAVAGATGYTGRRIMGQLVAHERWRGLGLVRPRSSSALPDRYEQVVCDLADAEALAAALRGCAAVIQTIGTTRAQFKEGVSYETVDYGTTAALLSAARAAGVERVLLLSSVGAGAPVGAYLHWKARTEQLVRDSDARWTILRPSAIVGPGRRGLQLAGAPLHPLRYVPPLRGFAQRYRPMHVDLLARCFVTCLDSSSTVGQTLEGESLWALVA